MFSMFWTLSAGWTWTFCAHACITIGVRWKMSEETVASSGFVEGLVGSGGSGRIMLSTVGLVCLHSVAPRRRPPSVPPSVARCRVGTREQWKYDLDAWHRTKMTNLHALCLACGQYPLSSPSFSQESLSIWILTSTSKSDSPVCRDDRTRRVS